MTNIVLVTNGTRPRLLKQTLETLIQNTIEPFTLTLVDDGDNPSVSMVLGELQIELYTRLALVRISPACHVIGRLKNLGAYWSEKHFSRGDWLMFIDDDLAFLPGWLPAMIDTIGQSDWVKILGGVRHPFHGVNTFVGVIRSWNGQEIQNHARDIELTDAVAGYCHFMRWETWDYAGPYDAHAKGTGRSEDFKICRDLVKQGKKVGYISPPVMAHCGITSSEGKPILGGDLIERLPNILYE